MVAEIRSLDAQRKAADYRTKVRLVKEAKRKGYSNVAIAQKFEISESTVRKMLKEPGPKKTT